MKLLNKSRRRSRPLYKYTTGSEFCVLYVKELKSLYLLALLLTADPELAEECIISSLDTCLSGTAVCTQWAHSWAKRSVIKNAIRLVDPQLSVTPKKARETFQELDGELRKHNPQNPASNGVLGLRNFERIVFVMRILEKYSVPESAALLKCSQREIREAQIRALQQLLESNPSHLMMFGRYRPTSREANEIAG